MKTRFSLKLIEPIHMKIPMKIRQALKSCFQLMNFQTVYNVWGVQCIPYIVIKRANLIERRPEQD